MTKRKCLKVEKIIFGKSKESYTPWLKLSITAPFDIFFTLKVISCFGYCWLLRKYEQEFNRT